MKTKIYKTLLLLSFFFWITILSAQSNGETLFKTNCGACHNKSEKRSVGPGLKGISQKRSEEWIIKWVKDSPKLIASGDADAQAIFNEFNKQSMPTFAQLSDEDIRSVVAFIEEPEEAAPVAETMTSKEEENTEKNEETLMYIGLIFALTLLVVAYAKMKGIYFKNKLISGGYSINEDKQQIRDIVSQFYKSNSTWIFILILSTLALVVRSCVGELIP